MRPLLLGHRGVRPASRFRPATQIPAENTLAAFEYALDHGCDGFEFDVRVTQDARQVICHDPVFCGAQVANSAYESLRSATGEPLACLEDVLLRFGPRAYLDIELKVPGAEQAVVEALRRMPPERGYLASSFLPEVLLRLHQLEPVLPLGFICDRAEYAAWWRSLPISIFLPQYKFVTEEMIADVHAHGVKLFTWTVNRASDLTRLAGWGVDGLISDDPLLLSRTFPPAAPAGMN